MAEFVRLSVNINDESAQILREVKADRGWSTTEAVRRAIGLLDYFERARREADAGNDQAAEMVRRQQEVALANGDLEGAARLAEWLVENDYFSRTSFRCGSCGADLRFESRRFPTPRARYVHADNGRFRCAPPRRTNAHSSRLILPWETFSLPAKGDD